MRENYENNNTEKLMNNYKTSTLDRLINDYGYNKNDLDKCKVLNTYFLIEKNINPFKTSTILLDYVSKKKGLNEKSINYWIDLVSYKPPKKLYKYH